ncbi:MAG: twin-arginine translocase TatA/TatE family subunit [Sphingomonas bacterium]|nr:twin-arginine translocase TatA/TatE family subunit [Sphingomonas bacterium]
MGGFSLWHILIFAVIVLLLFGGNRFSAMMGDVAKGLKSFKKGMTDEEEAKPQDRASDRNADEPRQIPPQSAQQQPIDITPRPADPVVPPPPPSSSTDQTR